MKKLLIGSVLAIALLSSTPVFAHGKFWGSSFVAGVLTARYNRPVYYPNYYPRQTQFINVQQVVYVQPQNAAPQYIEAIQNYYCPFTESYYSAAQARGSRCPGGWVIDR